MKFEIEHLIKEITKGEKLFIRLKIKSFVSRRVAKLVKVQKNQSEIKNI
jgi:hypothetical protein